MQVVTKAIVVHRRVCAQGIRHEYMDDIPQGAEEADGPDRLSHVVRDQIKHGAIGSRCTPTIGGATGEAMPGPTQDEFNLLVNIAKSSGRRRPPPTHNGRGKATARWPGETIEHGDGARRSLQAHGRRGICSYRPCRGRP